MLSGMRIEDGVLQLLRRGYRFAGHLQPNGGEECFSALLWSLKACHYGGNAISCMSYLVLEMCFIVFIEVVGVRDILLSLIISQNIK